MVVDALHPEHLELVVAPLLEPPPDPHPVFLPNAIPKMECFHFVLIRVFSVGVRMCVFGSRLPPGRARAPVQGHQAGGSLPQARFILPLGKLSPGCITSCPPSWFSHSALLKQPLFRFISDFRPPIFPTL